MNCLRCATPIAPADVNEEAALAKCSRCGEVFITPPPARKRPAVAMPTSIRVQHDGRTLLITRRWYDRGELWILFLGVLMLPLLVLGVYRVFVVVTDGYRFLSLLLLLLPLSYLYVGLCNLLNSTEIRVGQSWLTVRHVPVPGRRSRMIAARHINQLYCTTVYQARTSQTVLAVEIVMTGGDRQLLLADLSTLEEAEFIEQEIARYLGIADRPVVGGDLASSGLAS